MDDYISREALLAELAADYGKWISCNDTDESYCKGVRDNFADTISLVNEMPVADVQPVKYGKWEMNSDYPDRLICNQCNSTYDVYFCKRDSMHYCPNCGSKNRMDGDNK